MKNAFEFKIEKKKHIFSKCKETLRLRLEKDMIESKIRQNHK